MFITLNNAKSSSYDLFKSLKRIYQSIYLALTDEKLSSERLIVSTGKVPNRKRVMDMVVKNQPIVAAGIHKFNKFNQSTGRGSLSNYDDYHLHLYIYGVHTYLQQKEGRAKFEKLKAYLHRYLNAKRKLPSNAVLIEQVGINSNVHKDKVSPTSIFDYLMMPYTNPEKDSCINYIAETKRDSDYRHPLYFIYQDI